MLTLRRTQTTQTDPASIQAHTRLTEARIALDRATAAWERAQTGHREDELRQLHHALAAYRQATKLG